MGKRPDDPNDPKPGAESADSGAPADGPKPAASPAAAVTGGTQTKAAEDGADGPARDDELTTAGRDLLFAYGKTEAGDGYRVVRSRDDRLEIGEVRELRAHKPIHGDVVKLAPVEGYDKLYDVEVLAEGPKTRSTTGPVRVSNALYREQWEAIFGGEPSDPRELN